MTNNPKKIVGLEGYGLEVAERVPLEVIPHKGNLEYLRVKKEKMGHMLGNLEDVGKKVEPIGKDVKCKC